LDQASSIAREIVEAAQDPDVDDVADPYLIGTIAVEALA
jgi:hypothetical protein